MKGISLPSEYKLPYLNLSSFHDSAIKLISSSISFTAVSESYEAKALWNWHKRKERDKSE